MSPPKYAPATIRGGPINAVLVNLTTATVAGIES